MAIVGKMWYDILTKVNQLMNQLANHNNIRLGEREPLRPNQFSISPPLSAMPSFSFAAEGMAPPAGLKALPQHHQ